MKTLLMFWAVVMAAIWFGKVRTESASSPSCEWVVAAIDCITVNGGQIGSSPRLCGVGRPLIIKVSRLSPNLSLNSIESSHIK